MANLIEVDDNNFGPEVLEAEVPVLVDFGADWCAPCKHLDPIVEQLEQEWDGKVKVRKVDADKSTDTTMEYGVMSLPTLILFVGGEPKERLSGFQPKQKILEKVNPHL